ncbi:chromosome partitioning protein [Micromonospora sp. NPDC047074]|uniref:chromosome partitioning protein n=1 Tax=Micromonospora sp. NPDC047074 TaxID=3154339 RepID=UPI003404128F
MPERDIEPLWPPDQIDGGAPTWAPTATPTVPPRSRPGQPPSPADYPSLTEGVPALGSRPAASQGAATGWVPPPAAATGWEPASPAPTAPPAPEAGGAPAPRAPQAAPARVDLHMPFSLDQPATPTPVTPARVAPIPITPVPVTPAPVVPIPVRPTPVTPSPSTGGGPVTAATEASPVTDVGPTDAGPTDPGPTGAGTTDAGYTNGGPVSGVPVSGGPVSGVPVSGGPVSGGPVSGGPVSGAPGNGGGTRMPTESPWAQPPQRPTTTAVAPEPATGTPDPTPAAQGAAPRPGEPRLSTDQQGTDQRAVDQHAADQQGTDQHAVDQQGTEQQGTEQLDAERPYADRQHPDQQDAATGPAVGPDPAAAHPTAPPGPYPPHQAGPYPPQQAGPYPPQQAGPYPPQQGAPQQAGPYPPGWYPPHWQPVAPGVAAPAPQQAYQPAEGAAPMPAQPDPNWHPSITTPPTAEDFARRRQGRPADPVAAMGVRAVANRLGLRLAPGRHEQELRRDIETVRRNFGGLRQVTVVNPKGGAGKTVAILLLAMTFGQKRGGYVLAWDNNETQGTLGMRAQQDFHSRTVRDMLRDLSQFQGAHGRVGDLSQYVRSQGEGMFDVLASDESATGGEMLTAAAFAEIREVVSRFYKLIFVDTGNNVRAQNWQAAMDATDQLVVTMSARNDSAETAARMLDHLEQSGRQRLVRQAVTVVSMPPSRKEIDLPAIQEHFAARTRAVLLAPYERLIDSGEPIRYGGLSAATRDAWLKIAAAVAEGL